MTDILKNVLDTTTKDLSNEFKRVFHGRGGIYEELKFLTVDSIDKILFVQFFYDNGEETENQILKFLKNFIKNTRHTSIVVKRRYKRPVETFTYLGEIDDEVFAIENGIKFKLNLFDNQNNGYFGDMKNARSYIESISNNKTVLNLFAYTCGFSLFARRGGAKKIVNVDMAKNALATGMKNHHINNLETKNISFLPYNILKSLNKLKKHSPFDIIIIDPPTFQKNSFDVTKDYEKIVKFLPNLSNEETVLLLSLNSPDLDDEFLKSMVSKHLKDFYFETKIKNLDEYKSLNEKKSLKNLVFKRKSIV